MSKTSYLAAKTALCLLFLGSLAHAETTISIPEDAKFEVRVNLDALRETELGKQFMAAVQELAAKEIGSKASNSDKLANIQKMLGFDPFEDPQSITFFGTNSVNPQEEFGLVLKLKRTTGNLEGLVLALPNYQSSKHGNYTIHSAAENKKRAYGAIHNGSTVVVARKLDALKAMLDRLNKRGSEVSPPDRETFAGANDALVNVLVRDLPQMDLGKGPYVNTIKLVKEVSVTIQDDRGDFVIDVKLTTNDDKPAEQIQQLIQGLVAMIDLTQAPNEGDENLKLIAELLQKICRISKNADRSLAARCR